MNRFARFWAIVPAMRILLLLSLVGLLGCNPTFAPPVRTGVGSMPDPAAGRPSAAVVGYGGEGRLHARSFHRYEEGLDIEAALAINAHPDAPEERFFLTGPGVVKRTTFGPDLPVAYSGGIGLGCGGAHRGYGGCTRSAAGMHVGADLGFPLPGQLGFYQANRLQWTLASGVPTTLWGVHLAGLQYDVHRDWFVSGEFGFWWYLNRIENESGLHGNLSVGTRWDEP